MLFAVTYRGVHPPHKPMMHITYFPRFPKNVSISPYFCKIYMYWMLLVTEISTFICMIFRVSYLFQSIIISYDTVWTFPNGLFDPMMFTDSCCYSCSIT